VQKAIDRIKKNNYGQYLNKILLQLGDSPQLIPLSAKRCVMTDSKLKIACAAIPDILIIEPKDFGDNRSWFAESFNASDFALATNFGVQFVQDNHSFSRQ
jgi:hypothetical protein